jgi:PPK2 family polyphosphate:nucleotide phosphotransferase
LNGSAYPDCRVRPGAKLSLADLPTEVEPAYTSDDDARRRLAAQVERTAQLQERLYAENRRALLVVFQAMDAAGKDSCIEHVFSGVNPQGCRVTSFKQPSSEELDHDFLWRCTRALPPRGQIGIFNRSYYEEVLVVRVHPELLVAQRLPGKTGDAAFWKARFESIRRFEEHLVLNGTQVVKFHLHLSRREQAKRFLARLDDPAKSWKFAAGDLRGREYWDDYRRAYEDCIEATSTDDAPWYVVPADDKKNARLIVSAIVADTLAAMDPRFPEPTPAERAEQERCRALLTGAKAAEATRKRKD